MDHFSILSRGCIKAQDTFFVVGEEDSVFTVKVQEYHCRTELEGGKDKCANTVLKK